MKEIIKFRPKEQPKKPPAPNIYKVFNAFIENLITNEQSTFIKKDFILYSSKVFNAFFNGRIVSNHIAYLCSIEKIAPFGMSENYIVYKLYKIN